MQYYQARSKSAGNVERFKAIYTLERFKAIHKATYTVFGESYFPCCTKECFKLSEDTRSIESAKKKLNFFFNYIRPKGNSVYTIHDISGPNY